MGNMFQISVLSALGVNLVLGVLVFYVNPKRRANRYFLLASGIFTAYTACLAFGAFAVKKSMLVFWIQQASAASLLLPAAFDLFRLAITHAEKRVPLVSRQLWAWAPLILGVAIVCQTPLFIRDIEVTATGFGKPLYGPGQLVYVGYWIVALVILGRSYHRDLRRTQGMVRVELEFTVLAFVSSVIFGLGVAQAIPLLTGNREVTQFLPLAVIVLNGVIAYGVVTQRIMSVSDVLRRATAYGLLTVYLVCLYLAVDYVGTAVLSGVMTKPAAISHVLAAVAVAFSMAPAHGRMQRVANRLFINMQPMDVRGTIQKANETLMTIGTVDELMSRFAEIMTGATGSERVIIFLLENGTLRQGYPSSPEDLGYSMSGENSLVEMLLEEKRPVSVDSIRRMRGTSQRKAAGKLLESFQASIAVGIHYKEALKGVLFLGRRLSGRIYGVIEQEALQLICNQLGVALENSRLYTEAEDSRIYNDILLDSIVSGIVAANVAREITVCNREAQRIAGVEPSDLVGKPVDVLPTAIAYAIETTLANGAELLNEDVTLVRSSGAEIPIRLSSSAFSSHTGEALGALLVFQDMTTVKKLEEQVRRTDRLASLGTLSAGMAHEIKNPLVSIKTFAQLLPDRYRDDEFRETFFDLISQEVRRIDDIVSRLLRFARPAKPSLVRLDIHGLLHNALLLVEQQLDGCEIELNESFKAKKCGIEGDSNLLSQAFVNFFLNAIEAMQQGGTLMVSTSVVRGEGPVVREAGVELGSLIRVSIGDTGHGIAAEDLPRVFDPFFTTKSSGTGLGLSVAHGIIQEHGATVDVESKIGRGTTFHVMFPLADGREKEA